MYLSLSQIVNGDGGRERELREECRKLPVYRDAEKIGPDIFFTGMPGQVFKMQTVFGRGIILCYNFF